MKLDPDPIGSLINLNEKAKQFDALNTQMPCGHLVRYQFEEDGTQYCSMCQLKSLLDYLDLVANVLKEHNEERNKEREQL